MGVVGYGTVVDLSSTRQGVKIPVVEKRKGRMANDFDEVDIERDAAVPDAAATAQEPAPVVTQQPPRSTRQRRKCILASVAAALLIVAVAAGLGAGLSRRNEAVPTSSTSSSSVEENSLPYSTGDDTSTTGSTTSTASTNDGTEVQVASGLPESTFETTQIDIPVGGGTDPDPTSSASPPSATTSNTNDGTEAQVPSRLPETSQVDIGRGADPNPVSSANASSSELDPELQDEETVGSTASFSPDGSSISSYVIEWSTTKSGCSGKPLVMTASCPMGAVLVEPSPGCSQINDKSVYCDGTSKSVHVACYAPPGRESEDLFVTARLPDHPFYCNRLLRSEAGFYPTQYYGGNAKNMVEIYNSNKCTSVSGEGEENSMKSIRSSRGDESCTSSWSCGFGLGCTGSKGCNAVIRGRDVSVRSTDDPICVEDFVTTLKVGEKCYYDVMCSSNSCVDGICSEATEIPVATAEIPEATSEIPEATAEIPEVCDDGGDCSSGSCGFIDYSRTQKVCCESESFSHKQCSVCSGTDYCLNEAPVGANCGGNIDKICESGACIGNKCQNKLSGGSVCDSGDDCILGACGFIDLDRKAQVCCASGESFSYRRRSFHILYNYCQNEAPTGANCGNSQFSENVGQMCISETCEFGVCK